MFEGLLAALPGVDWIRLSSAVDWVVVIFGLALWVIGALSICWFGLRVMSAHKKRTPYARVKEACRKRSGFNGGD
jgi:hypothetical protein